MMASPLWHRWRLLELHDEIEFALKDDQAVLSAASRVDPVEDICCQVIERRNAQRRDRLKQAKILRGSLDPLTAQLYQSIARAALGNATDFARHRVRHLQLMEVGQ